MRNDALSSMPTEFADVNALLAVVEVSNSVFVVHACDERSNSYNE